MSCRRWHIGLAVALLAVAGAFVGNARADSGLSFQRQAVPDGGYGQQSRTTGVEDVNGDGKPDIVEAGDSYVVWYQNPTWTPHLVATGAYGDAGDVQVHDMNGDGRPDIVTGDSSSYQEVWFENTPTGWVRHVLATDVDCHNLQFVDLNGDGRLDMACLDELHSTIAWLENMGGSPPTWQTHVIDDTRTAYGLAVGDIDRDGRPDIVAGRAWYRNNPDGTWTRNPFTAITDDARPNDPAAPGSFFDDFAYPALYDINGDGRLDIFVTMFPASLEGQVWAFLAPADPLVGTWTPVLVDPGPLYSVHTTDEGNFDGTGRPQFLVAEMTYGGWDFPNNPDPQTYIYRLEGPATDPASWRRYVVDAVGTHEAHVVDVDGDGRLDFVGGDENSLRAIPPRHGNIDVWRNVAGLTAAAPASTAAPAVSGSPRVDHVLYAQDGSWSSLQPLAFVHQWQRCNAQGASCAAISGQVGPAYTATATDVGKTLRVRVTASNAVGSTSAASAVVGPVTAAATGVPTGFDAVVTSSGCSTCTVTSRPGGTIAAHIAGGADTVDTAYANLDTGPQGLPGRVYFRDVLSLPAGQALTENLIIDQVRDTAGALVFTLYLLPDRSVAIYTPPGGIDAASFNESTGVQVPNDGTSSVRVEVSLQANESLVVRVDGVRRIIESALAGATTGNVRTFRVGIDHYNSTATVEPVEVDHAAFAVSAVDWLGPPPAAGAPQSIALPAVSGSIVEGRTLTTTNGTWTGSPTSFAHSWLRCSVGFDDCSPIAGAAASTYVVTGNDVGFAIRSDVAATNASGTAAANSLATDAAAADVLTPLSPPQVSGAATVGAQLSATFGAWRGGWLGSPTAYAYQWERCDTGGATCAPITGETGTTYVVQPADAGATLRVQVVASVPGTMSAPAASDATATVSAGSPRFGNPSAGTTWVPAGADYKFGSVFRLDTQATVTDFAWYVRGGTVAQRFTPVIYSTDSQGQPSSLLAVGSEVTVAAGQAAGWVTATLPPTTLAPGSYLLGLTSGPTSGGASNAMTPVTGAGFYDVSTYGSPEATWGATSTEDAEWSVYVDYTTSTGATRFGNTTAGTTWVTPAANYKFGSVFTLSTQATVVDFAWYTRGGTVAQRFTPVIYATDSQGEPSTRLVVGSEVTVAAGQAAGWVTATLPATVLPAGSYLLGLTSGPTGGGASNAMTPTPGAGFYDESTYGSPSATWGATSTEDARWSFYVDYHT